MQSLPAHVQLVDRLLDLHRLANRNAPVINTTVIVKETPESYHTNPVPSPKFSSPKGNNSSFSSPSNSKLSLSINTNVPSPLSKLKNDVNDVKARENRILEEYSTCRKELQEARNEIETLKSTSITLKVSSDDVHNYNELKQNYENLVKNHKNTQSMCSKYQEHLEEMHGRYQKVLNGCLELVNHCQKHNFSEFSSFEWTKDMV